MVQRIKYAQKFEKRFPANVLITNTDTHFFKGEIEFSIKTTWKLLLFYLKKNQQSLHSEPFSILPKNSIVALNALQLIDL